MDIKKLIILCALAFSLSGCGHLFSMVTEHFWRGTAVIVAFDLVNYAYDKGVENQGHDEIGINSELERE